ncbi:methyltransferase domain-containing protein [Patescibacteria group bacterium]|nr:methyltransferase domain-containing protein [Patescibacteria group bacterium]MBU1754971.1 methyltransferase domain-containing protein [Patescibacteria group bacterium]
MQFCDPQANVLQLGIREGMKVGDFGAGSGHYAVCASPIVGDTGTIYALDIQEDVLTHITNVCESRGIKNIETVWGNFEKPGGSKLKDDSLDAVILSNALFQLEHRENAIKEIKRVLKTGGRLLVIDWAGAYDGMGPPPDQVVAEAAAESLFITAGFHKVKGFRGGPHHYSLVFTAP